MAVETAGEGVAATVLQARATNIDRVPMLTTAHRDSSTTGTRRKLTRPRPRDRARMIDVTRVDKYHGAVGDGRYGCSLRTLPKS
eukprot:943041-Heterocapsa_arctica.AAC.1